MMSGMRKAPPISTSSPRETTTSLPGARVDSVSSTAAALLLTMVAASAPVSSQISCSTRSSRSPRPPVSRSYSRLAGLVRASTTASTASCGSRARPRLVCSTVPVRLNTDLRRGAKRSVRRCCTAVVSTVSCTCSACSEPSRSCRRRVSSTCRTALVTLERPNSVCKPCKTGVCSSLSTEGRRGAAVFNVELAMGLRPAPTTLDLRLARWCERY